MKRFPGAVFANRIPSSHASFVDAEMNSLVGRGCVVKWPDVRDSSGPVRPRLIQALSVEETKPRLIYDAWPLNQRCNGSGSRWIRWHGYLMSRPRAAFKDR